MIEAKVTCGYCRKVLEGMYSVDSAQVEITCFLNTHKACVTNWREKEQKIDVDKLYKEHLKRMKYRYYEKVGVTGWYTVIIDDGKKDFGELSSNEFYNGTGTHHTPFCDCYSVNAKEHAKLICKLLNDHYKGAEVK